jgi:FkbM family methyltransferase
MQASRILNGRSFSLISRNVARPTNYIALARAARVYERPLTSVARYFVGGGDYPWPVRVRTPIGTQNITLFNSQDIITVHEIFCRQDYRCPSPPQVVVDLGSNIGVSALYFLTRSPSTYCELYEPDPRNYSRLLENIQGYEDRCVVNQAAVADTEGTLPFTREPTGRYGALGKKSPGWGGPGAEEISVRVENINTVLERAISRHDVIDLLKIDTEGSELATVRAIDPSLLKHIRHIAIEWEDHTVKLNGFRVSSSCDVVKFANESMID